MVGKGIALTQLPQPAVVELPLDELGEVRPKEPIRPVAITLPVGQLGQPIEYRPRGLQVEPEVVYPG